MTGPASAWDVDGVEVSPIQQRAVMRDLRRALGDPQLDGVVLGRALHGGEWKDGFDSAVECVDARIEHLTGHIEGLADPVPPAPPSRRGLDALDVWDGSVAPGGWVCDVCRLPIESEPCREHQPKAYAEMRAEARTTTAGDDRGRELAEQWIAAADRLDSAAAAARAQDDLDTAVRVTVQARERRRCAAELASRAHADLAVDPDSARAAVRRFVDRWRELGRGDHLLAVESHGGVTFHLTTYLLDKLAPAGPRAEGGERS